jgi:hypothetical protein
MFFIQSFPFAFYCKQEANTIIVLWDIFLIGKFVLLTNQIGTFGTKKATEKIFGDFKNWIFDFGFGFLEILGKF